MKNKKAIVTIAISEKHRKLWEQYAARSWNLYAEKYGYDIVCITDPLDKSERALKRSPSWQKCLILGHPDVKGYDRVVWLDSDIIINHLSAPCIVSLVDEKLIGAVNAWVFPGFDNYASLHQRMIDYCKHHGMPFFEVGEKYFIDYGMPAVSDKAVQGGVLVLTTKLHASLLEDIYNNYEDNRSAHWHYEMRPLSYELITRQLVQWIDLRFNYVLENLKLAKYYNNYPRNYAGRVLRIVRIRTFNYLAPLGIEVWQERMVKQAFESSYFLHFAGNAKEMVFARSIVPQQKR